MTTEEYIRDPRFKMHCVGFRYEDIGLKVQPALYHADEEINKSAVLCHHAQFDGLILNHHYGVKPAFWFDTLSMARMVIPHAKSHSLGALAEELGLGKKEISYESFKGIRDLPADVYKRLAAGCARDVELTYAVFQRLLPYVPRDELRIIDLTVRMFTEPALVLDRPLMEWYVAQLAAKKEALLVQLGVTKQMLGSNDKFAEILRGLGIEPPTKPSPTGKGLIYAFAKTDEGMRELLDDEDDQVALLAEARIETKSTGTQTRGQRLLGMDSRGALPVYLNYCGAHTLRDSGGDSMNWQNFKRIDFDAEGKPVWDINQRGMVRLAICAPPGYVIAVADASQIECRLLNWFAGQQDVLDKFANKVDIYSELASMFYGFPVTKKNKAERGTGKQLELSCGYGAGGETIVRTARLGIYGPPVTLTEEEGKKARDLYRGTHPHVQALWKEANGILHILGSNQEPFQWRHGLQIRDNRIYGPGGTWLDYTNLEYKAEDKEWRVRTRKGRSRMYGAKLVENVIQWLARIALMEAALQISKRYRIVMRTHDELAALVPEAEGQEAVDWMCNIMRTPPAWCPGVPLDAEGGFDVRYSK
jgi:hypothetical protein